MPRLTVAVQAVRLFVMRADPIHGLHHGLVAAEARAFHHVETVFLDDDGFMKILKSERRRVSKAVQSLHGVLSDKVMRQMAVVAFGHMVMGRLLPGVHIVAHNVAIDAGLGIVGQVRISPGVNERIRTKTDHQTEQSKNQQRKKFDLSHAAILFDFHLAWQEKLTNLVGDPTTVIFIEDEKSTDFSSLIGR